MGRPFWLWLGLLLAMSFTLSLLFDVGVMQTYVSPERPLFVGLYWVYVLALAYVFFAKIAYSVLTRWKLRRPK